eukprot:CAMPEP_0168553842 /NCGR_PEP_ID=MMETSP0413-20121227/7460_1 /TAXON_ID=136452 /ORGANISM="Filamoeba nolandi, Strain NC-AS-23-1" /LENGTH=303 /DNA_ID=CAMNT_0008584539 /DNA_START=174 /DNA_END=1085 /DNA_ORIENTATION=+
MTFAVLEDSPERLVFTTSGVPQWVALIVIGSIMFPAIIILATTIAFSWVPALVFVILLGVSVGVGRFLMFDSVPTTWIISFVNGRLMVHKEKNSCAICLMPAVSEDYELASGTVASLQYGGRFSSRVVLHLASGEFLPTTKSFSNMYWLQKQDLVSKLNSIFTPNQQFYPVPQAQPVYIPPPEYPTGPSVPPSAYVPPSYAEPGSAPYAPPPTAYAPPPTAYVPPPVQPAPYAPTPYYPPEVPPSGYAPPPVVTDPSGRSVGQQPPQEPPYVIPQPQMTDRGQGQQELPPPTQPSQPHEARNL